MPSHIKNETIEKSFSISLVTYESGQNRNSGMLNLIRTFVLTTPLSAYILTLNDFFVNHPIIILRLFNIIFLLACLNIHDAKTRTIIHIQIDSKDDQTQRCQCNTDCDHPREAMQSDLHTDRNDAEYTT